MIKYVLKNGSLLIAALAVTLVLIEVLLRLTGVSATSANTMPVTLTNQIVTNKPNTTYRFARGPFGEINHVKQVNNYGFVSHRDFAREGDNRRIALVGGSWILADQVRMEDSIGFQLDERLSSDIYPISYSQPNLAQNLGFIDLAVNKLHVDATIVVLANEALFLSLTERSPGKRIFGADGDLTIATEFLPSPVYRLATSSHLVNYLIKNMQVMTLVAGAPAPRSTPDAAVLARRSEQVDTAIKFFVSGLDRFGVARNEILFVFAPDFPVVVENKPRPATSNFRKLEAALQQAGYRTFDLHAPFVAVHERDGKSFTFLNDSHWNEYGQQVAADLISRHFNAVQASTRDQ